MSAGSGEPSKLPPRQARQGAATGRLSKETSEDPMPHVNANGLDIYYESHGPETAEPVLLIMGLGAQMSRWSPELIGELTNAGHRVIAYDNRDIGLSEKLDAAGPPDIAAAIGALRDGRKPDVAYRLDDMAADAAAL